MGEPLFNRNHATEWPVFVPEREGRGLTWRHIHADNYPNSQIAADLAKANAARDADAPCSTTCQAKACWVISHEADIRECGVVRKVSFPTEETAERSPAAAYAPKHAA